MTGFAGQGITIQLECPVTGEKLDSFITVQGADGSVYKNKRIAIQKSSYGKESVDHEDNGVQLMCAITMGWSGLSLGAKEIKYSEEEARKLYTKFDWISDQVFSAVNDRKLFLVNAKAV